LLLREGASVTIAGRRVDVLKDAVEQLSKEGFEGSVTSVICDVTDEDQVSAAVAAAAGDGNIDILVNNAGAGLPGTLMQLDAAGWRMCTDVNLLGPALCMKHAALRMCEHGGGSIVNISSMAATNYQSWLIAYSAAKAAQDMLTKSAAVELAEHGIRVNAVAPGFVDTHEEMSAFKAPHARITPLGRVGQPEDIAQAVLHFASDRSNWTTGQILAVDGGIALPVLLSMQPAVQQVFGDEMVEKFGVREYRSVPS
jgi:NAD(P)-dependent dehydrogenase (short-subunit alcohol dehydrogenase family)